MLDSNPRTKMISLRLSEGEYEVLKARYRTYGARNVSDLARLALEQVLSTPDTPHNAMIARLAEFDERLQALESSVALITRPKS
jgi:hypothetical protein